MSLFGETSEKVGLPCDLAVKQERQEVADHKTFAKGEPEHLVLTQAKQLPDPLDECLVPKKDRADLHGLLRFFGFISPAPMMALTRLRSPAPSP